MRNLVKVIAIVLMIVFVIGMLKIAWGFASYETLKGSEDFPADDVDQLRISSEIADVHVLPSNSDAIEVVWTGKIRGNTKVDLELKSNTLNVDIERKNIFNFFQFGFHFGSLSVDVFIPEKQFTEIDMENNIGDSHISDVSTRELIVHTDVGDATIENVETELLEVESNVGDMRINHSSGFLSAVNDVGDIHIIAESISDDMELQTDVGGIHISLSSVPSDVSFRADTEIGSTSVFGENGSYIIKDGDYSVDMKTDVGDIEVVAE
ncbi:DUF4097 family beta strand repeat-containing protein [Virgibacillus ainsalahensis]